MTSNTFLPERVLTYTEDWEDWLEQTKEFMDTIDLWKYINPYSNKPPGEPQQPDFPTMQEIDTTFLRSEAYGQAMNAKIAYLGQLNKVYKEFKDSREKAVQYLQRTVGPRGRLVLKRIKADFAENRSLHERMCDLKDEFAPHGLHRRRLFRERLEYLGNEDFNVQNHRDWTLEWIRLKDRCMRHSEHGESIEEDIVTEFIDAVLRVEPNTGHHLLMRTVPMFKERIDLEKAIQYLKHSFRRTATSPSEIRKDVPEAVFTTAIQTQHAEVSPSSQASVRPRPCTDASMSEDRETSCQTSQQEDLPFVKQTKKQNSKTKKTPSSSPPAPPKATVEDGDEDDDKEKDNEPVQRPESPPPAKWTKKPTRNTSTPELSTPEASPLPTPPSPAPSSAAGVLGASKKTYGCGTVTGKPADKECKSLRNCNVINPLIRPEPEYQTAEWKTQFAAFKKYCRQHPGFAMMAAEKHNDPVAESIHLKNQERERARKVDLEEKSREVSYFAF